MGEVKNPIMFSVLPGEVKYFEYAQITQGYKKYGDTEVADVKEYFLKVPAVGQQAIRKARLLGYWLRNGLILLFKEIDL